MNRKVIILIIVIVVLALVTLAVIYVPSIIETLTRFHRIPQH